MVFIEFLDFSKNVQKTYFFENMFIKTEISLIFFVF